MNFRSLSGSAACGTDWSHGHAAPDRRHRPADHAAHRAAVDGRRASARRWRGSPIRCSSNLAREIEAQGVARKVAADMFGLALRSYQKKIQRIAQSATDSEQTLWERRGRVPAGARRREPARGARSLRARGSARPRRGAQGPRDERRRLLHGARPFDLLRAREHAGAQVAGRPGRARGRGQSGLARDLRPPGGTPRRAHGRAELPAGVQRSRHRRADRGRPRRAPARRGQRDPALHPS